MPNPNSPPTIKKRCLICNKIFKVYPYRKDTAKYCSRKCYAKTVHLQKRTKKWYQVMKGHVPWNKGKHTGIRPWLGKKRPEMTGEKHPHWNGGVTTKNRMERIRFRRTIQKEVLKRDNYICQMCGQKGGKLQIDHIQSWADYVELRFDINNCRTLCMKCHYFITFGNPMPKNIKVWGHNLKEVLTDRRQK